jgi:hypothetical protein
MIKRDDGTPLQSALSKGLRTPEARAEGTEVEEIWGRSLVLKVVEMPPSVIATL